MVIYNARISNFVILAGRALRCIAGIRNRHAGNRLFVSADDGRLRHPDTIFDGNLEFGGAE